MFKLVGGCSQTLGDQRNQGRNKTNKQKNCYGRSNLRPVYIKKTVPCLQETPYTVGS